MPGDWVERVNRPQSEGELEALRRSVKRSSPLGDRTWVNRIAAELGIESALRPRGRPRKLVDTADIVEQMRADQPIL